MHEYQAQLEFSCQTCVPIPTTSHYWMIMTKIAQVFLRLEMVVAVADNGVIGRELGLPWRQRADLAHFKALTLGHPILMGRKTWQGLGRALPGRLNLVLSRTPDDAMPGATGVSSLAQARDIALREQAQVESPVLMIIGGATVYAEAMPQVQVIHLTELHGSPYRRCVLSAMGSKLMDGDHAG